MGRGLARDGVRRRSSSLDRFSFDRFEGYSPPLSASVTNLSVPNAKPMLLALRVANNDRNAQLPLPSLSFSVLWSAVASHKPPSPISKYSSPAANAAVVRRGPLLYALRPAEERVVVRSYDDLLPERPLAVDYSIGTRERWAFALELPKAKSGTERSAESAVAAMRFDPTPSAGWSPTRAFSTDEYPFSVLVEARPLSNATWGLWRGSNITAQPPPSPLNCSALAAGSCGASETLRLVPFGATNIRISVFPWVEK